MVRSEAVISPASRPSQRRHHHLCPQCRKAKQKCLPIERDWEGKREKCRRCIKLGHECGPSERAQKRLGKRRSVMNITEDGHRSIRQHDATYMSDYKGSPESCKPALPLGEGESGMVQSVQIPSAEHVDLKYTIDIDRTAAETQARKIIAILADMNATRELLRRCLVTCERVQRWLGESLAQKVALEAYICAIEVDFQFEIQEALNLATDDLGFSKEFILSELLGIIYRYDHPPTSDELGLIGADQKLIQKILYISCKHKGNYSIADFICSRMRGISSHSAIDNYDKASQAVKNVLSGLKSISRQHFQKQVSFPSCHIAYLHGNATTALDLWSATSHDDPLVDMLERNMVHLAVYNLDIQMLGWLLKHEIGIDEVQHADLFGMTPLQIAACQDDLSCFSLLWQHGADKFVQDVRGRSILALAARNGSQKAVTFILQSGLRLPSLIPEPHEALESGHHHIADMIRTQYNQQTSPFDSTIHSEAARLHVEKTDTQIIKKRALNSKFCSSECQQEIASLDNYTTRYFDTSTSSESCSHVDYEIVNPFDLPGLHVWEPYCRPSVCPSSCGEIELVTQWDQYSSLAGNLDNLDNFLLP